MDTFRSNRPTRSTMTLPRGVEVSYAAGMPTDQLMEVLLDAIIEDGESLIEQYPDELYTTFIDAVSKLKHAKFLFNINETAK